MIPEGKTFASTYEQLTEDREPFLRRAMDTAMLTLPHLMVDKGRKGQDLPTPYQSVGARGVTSLSSKLLLTLFPPSQPFFRYKLEEFVIEELGAENDILTELRSTLKDMENSILTEMETQALRPRLHDALKQLVLGGNCCLHLPEEGGAKVHKLASYVCKRDPEDNLVLLIIKEMISPKLLPEEVQATLKGQSDKLDDSVPLFTGITLRKGGKFFDVIQEAGGEKIPKTRGSYRKDDLPFLVLRMEPLTGESYGYGYASSYLGDLKSLESLSQSLVEAASMSAKMLWLVNPMAQTSMKDLDEAPNGAIRPGKAEDVTIVRVEKANDMRVADTAVDRLTKSLGQAFLLGQSIQRKGERVTAEEIRMLAQELEDVLAGTYSLLSVEFQLPLVRLLAKRMQKGRKLPKINEKFVKPTIVTGLEALGRGHDKIRLDTYIAGAQAVLQDEFLKYHKPLDILERYGNHLGIKLDGMLATEEEIAQLEQQQQMAAAVSQLGGDAMRLANTNLQQAGQAEQPQ